MEVKYIHIKEEHNTIAASLVLPLIFNIIRPISMLDIGCGIGTWLSMAKSLGVDHIFGIDGAYVNIELLEEHISSKEFLSHDLNSPIDLGKKFNMVVCLEVAEHLPEASAAVLVESLIRHSDVILFSAAIPGQGGQNHLNEQWPEYWAHLFEEHEYVFLDIIRPLIWDNSDVDFWYKQNIFLVVKSNHELASKYAHSHISLIHPELFIRVNQNKDKQINSLKKQLAIHPLKRWIKSILK